MNDSLDTPAPLTKCRRGSAMVLALVGITTLLLVSAGLLGVTTSASRSVASALDQRRAFFAAEAALAEGVVALRSGGTGSVGTLATPAYFGEGAVWVTSSDLGDGRVQLDATALVGTGRAALEMVIDSEAGESELFSSTLNSSETLTLSASVVIDSYASVLGTYESQVSSTYDAGGGVTIDYANASGHVRSNQDVILNSDAHVFGDATPGLAGEVTFGTGAHVDGSTTPALNDFTFPPVEVPMIPPTGLLDIAVGDTQDLFSGDYNFSDLTIGKDATLIVHGPANIVVDRFTGDKNARLMVDATAGPVTVYCTGSYTHTSGFEADAVDGSPMALAFFITAIGDIVFPSATKIRGGYYVSDAEITFAAGNEAWGAFAARRINMSSGMAFHYDETLRDYWEADTGDGRLEGVEGLVWFETQVQPASLRRSRRDPFELLGVDPDALPRPAQAWDL